VQAVRSLMLNNIDGAIKPYEELARLTPKDAGAFVDLGRAQDAAGLAVKARASFERAIKLEQNNAAAHLRLATVLSQQGNSAGALRAFTAAEDLYRAASNAEGQAETLLRRGTFLQTIAELRAARETINKALALAEPLQHLEQMIRARLQLSSISASEGQFTIAQELASAAVDAALSHDLETVAAEGLLDLVNVMLYGPERDASADEVRAMEAHLQRALALGEKHEARRIVARARLQQAAVFVRHDRHRQAVETANGVLPFFRENGYRRYELTALSIISRGHELTGEYGEARRVAEEVLDIATTIEDDYQAGLALENLAGHATAVGALPDALQFRMRGEAIHRQQNDIATLAYDLTNRAELLIRIGRSSEADAALREVETGIEKKVEAFMRRARRARALRALDANVNLRHEEAMRRSREILEGADGHRDPAGLLAARLLAYAAATRGAQRIPNTDPWLTEAQAKTPFSRELRYWELAARLASGDARGVMEQAEVTLTWKHTATSPENEWRIAALGAAAARRLNDSTRAHELKERARTALDRLRAAWGDAARDYERRPDVAELIEKAGLNSRS
jgi:tetratricopeptide (TPR) repeat protein